MCTYFIMVNYNDGINEMNEWKIKERKILLTDFYGFLL